MDITCVALWFKLLLHVHKQQWAILTTLFTRINELCTNIAGLRQRFLLLTFRFARRFFFGRLSSSIDSDTISLPVAGVRGGGTSSSTSAALLRCPRLLPDDSSLITSIGSSSDNGSSLASSLSFGGTFPACGAAALARFCFFGGNPPWRHLCDFVYNFPHFGHSLTFPIPFQHLSQVRLALRTS
jgi:hypothetical protein